MKEIIKAISNPIELLAAGCAVRCGGGQWLLLITHHQRRPRHVVQHRCELCARLCSSPISRVICATSPSLAAMSVASSASIASKPSMRLRSSPGLGLGFGTEGVGGFNSGMMQRESWQPPTVDDLRTKNNQRETFCLTGHEGPAESKVTNRKS